MAKSDKELLARLALIEAELRQIEEIQVRMLTELTSLSDSTAKLAQIVKSMLQPSTNGVHNAS